MIVLRRAHEHTVVVTGTREDVLACRLVEADVIVASEGLNPTNPADDDELETPEGALQAQLSTSELPRGSCSYLIMRDVKQN